MSEPARSTHPRRSDPPVPDRGVLHGDVDGDKTRFEVVENGLDTGDGRLGLRWGVEEADGAVDDVASGLGLFQRDQAKLNFEGAVGGEVGVTTNAGASDVFATEDGHHVGRLVKMRVGGQGRWECGVKLVGRRELRADELITSSHLAAHTAKLDQSKF